MSFRRNIRGLRRGGGFVPEPFSPLDDPDLFGVWAPSGATDNGTTLTVPNLLSGGVNATATGANRPTISATALDGHPGLVTVGTDSLTIAIGALMATTDAVTVYWTGCDTVTTTMLAWAHGTGGDDTIQGLVGSALDSISFRRNAHTIATVAGAKYCPLVYPQVICYRMDGSRASGELLPIYQDRISIPYTETGAANTAGNFENTSFTWGSANGGTFRYDGVLGTLAIIGREHTDAEVTLWTRYVHQLNDTLQAKRFMWVGDSITSNAGVGHAQWRSEIQDLYDARGDGKRFYWTVGPVNPASVPYNEDRCFAFSGATSETIVDTYSPSYLAAGGWKPDIIPILIGTNDLGTGGKTTAQLAVTYGAMLDHFSGLYPNAKLVAQKILPRTDNGTIAAKVTDWNDNIHDVVVADAVSRGVRVISSSALADIPGYTYAGDGLHPDAAFGPTMAAAGEPETRIWAGVT